MTSRLNLASGSRMLWASGCRKAIAMVFVMALSAGGGVSQL